MAGELDGGSDRLTATAAFSGTGRAVPETIGMI